MDTTTDAKCGSTLVKRPYSIQAIRSGSMKQKECVVDDHMSSKSRFLTSRGHKASLDEKTKEAEQRSYAVVPRRDNQATSTSPLLLLLRQYILHSLLDIGVVLSRLRWRLRAPWSLHELHNPVRDRVHVGRAELALALRSRPRVRQQPP